MAGLKVHVKFLCFCLLLCLALGCLFFSAVKTIQAYQQVQQSHQRTLSGDVSSIDSWMTLPYIAHVYHIPESCLYQSLNLPGSWMVRHSTLRVIADHYALPTERLIQEVRQVILRYRKDHSICGTPTPLPSPAELLQNLPRALWKGKAV